MQESLYETADAGNTLSDSGCRRLSIRKRIQETLYQTADAEVFLSDSGCRSLSIRQRMQEKLYQTAEQKSLFQPADAGDTISDAAAV